MRRIAIVVALLVITLDVAAQGMPGGGGGRGRGGQMGHSRSDSDARRDQPTAARSVEPYGALERELPSLKVDLMIRESQLDAWRAVEGDVRDIAEMERARKRHLLALKGNEQSTALTFVAAMAEDDRVKAETAADFKRHFEALYALLDDKQREMVNRRVIQSQSDPLGEPQARLRESAR